MRVALYLRRSTNDELQADSLRVQRALLEDYARLNGHHIVAVYEDSASGRTVEGRDAFRRLIDRVKRGAPFEAVLIQDVSRWGRFENTDESAFYEFLCLRHGVAVLYVHESFGPADSPLAPLFKSAKRWMAAEFSREKARTVQRSQARVVRLGFMHGGAPPYGLRRILVRLDGSYVGELNPGDHKALSTMRVKLAPGDPGEIAVLCRMFEMYAAGSTLKAIASCLNAEGIPGSKGGRWQPAMVAYMLRNETYRGVVKYTIRAGATRAEIRDIADEKPSDRFVRTAGSHEPIIEESLWNAVQDRLSRQTWRRSDLDLAKELREAFERWGHVEARMLQAITDPAHWATYKNRFRRGYTEALETAYAPEVERAKASLRETLSREFQVRDFERGWLVNDLLYVAFKFAWPRAHRAGLLWPFAFEGTETEDVTIGFGFSPPPDVRAVETFFFQTWRFAKRKQMVGRTLTAKKSPHRFVEAKTPEHIASFMRTAIYFRNVRAEKRLLDAVAELPVVTITVLARELGWPVNATRVLYEKLSARGAPVPPLKGKHGRRIKVICPSCKSVRTLRASYAMQLKTDVCFECQSRRPQHKVLATCPRCGAERSFYPSQIAKMQNGAETVCKTCTFAEGRELHRQRVAMRRDIEVQKAESLFSVAKAVVQKMAQIPSRYLAPRVWSAQRMQAATMRWRDTVSGVRIRLTLHCADAHVERLAAHASDPVLIASVLDESRWTERHPDRRHDLAWNVTVIPPSDAPGNVRDVPVI
jgi:DNA invertase Pin-like site-specific DNA recombinase